MLKLEYNANAGRVMRLDDISTIGVSTATILEQSARTGRAEEALALADYYDREMRIMHDILMVWTEDIIRLMMARDSGAGNELAGELEGRWSEGWNDAAVGK